LAIDLKLAEEMLKRNINNRPLSQLTVDHYAEQMLRGEWQYTKVPIIFSDEGRLIDGQHRLTACAQSGMVIVSDVAFGAPDHAFAYIDTGKKRTAGDIFAIHDIKSHSSVAAITKVVQAYALAGCHPTNWAHRSTPSELYNYLCDNPDITLSLKAYEYFKNSRLANPSTMAGIYVFCARRDREMADRFFRMAADGFGAETQTDPAQVLHKRFIEVATRGMRLTPAMLMGLTITAWNRTRDGHSGRGLRFSPEKKLPKVR